MKTFKVGIPAHVFVEIEARNRGQDAYVEFGKFDVGSDPIEEIV